MMESPNTTMINDNIPRFEKAFQYQDNVTLQGVHANVKSATDERKLYHVNLVEGSCTCRDYEFRGIKCWHIRASEIKSGVL